MTIEKGRISGIQYMFSIACFIQASSMLTSFISDIGENDTWLMVLFGLLGCIPTLLIYLGLIRRFPDLNLVGINNAVFGPAAGKIVTVLYLWFFLTLTSLNLRDMAGFINLSFLPMTPPLVIYAVFIAVCALAVYSGLETVTRYSAAFVFTGFGILVFSILLTLNVMDLDNFLPVLEQPFLTYIRGGHITMTIPFGETVVFLMLVPNTECNKKYGRYLFGGVLIGGLSMLLASLRDIAVLGSSMTLFIQPSFVVLEMASFTEAVSRLEILFGIVLTILYFFKVAFLFYVTVLTFAELFGLTSYRRLVLLTAVLLPLYSLFIFPSAMEHAESGKTYVPFLWLLLETLLPLITLILACVRKIKEPEKEAA